MLEAQVYDPRDIIKGHYIVLSYPAERIRFSSVGGTRPAPGEKIYVELGPFDEPIPDPYSRHVSSNRAWTRDTK